MLETVRFPEQLPVCPGVSDVRRGFSIDCHRTHNANSSLAAHIQVNVKTHSEKKIVLS